MIDNNWLYIGYYRTICHSFYFYGILIKKLILSLAFVGAFLNVNADNTQPYDGSTAYININTGIAKLYNMPTGEWIGNMNAGYNFNRGIALEGGYNYFMVRSLVLM